MLCLEHTLLVNPSLSMKFCDKGKIDKQKDIKKIIYTLYVLVCVSFFLSLFFFTSGCLLSSLEPA